MQHLLGAVLRVRAVDAAGLAETAAVLAYTAIGLISAFLLARAVVTLRRDGQSAAATA